MSVNWDEPSKQTKNKSRPSKAVALLWRCYSLIGLQRLDICKQNQYYSLQKRVYSGPLLPEEASSHRPDSYRSWPRSGHQSPMDMQRMQSRAIYINWNNGLYMYLRVCWGILFAWSKYFESFINHICQNVFGLAVNCIVTYLQRYSVT